ncbi:hypothetical protein DKX38_006966 [Salix brachista]|uniref:DUF7875 domain-containing protein n=1 Tax=Salix brachista TaxID=2182728 RepID=A0A5N5MLI4_9ROSI|nr:hypothetical protein DKX38_006828 [Salix brachista]KAB5556057.1 hypothetical protein DKX38_006966 [Salix brachista]
MALRRLCGFSDGELMRSDCKPCSRLMRQTAGIFSVGGAFGFWILCRLHYAVADIKQLFKWKGFDLIGVTTLRNQWGHLRGFFSCVCCGVEPNGPRITNPRSLRWAGCGAIAWSSTSALLVRLFSPECEPQNIAAYDKVK